MWQAPPKPAREITAITDWMSSLRLRGQRLQPRPLRTPQNYRRRFVDKPDGAPRSTSLVASR
jgi:hypothetical protein